MNIFAGQRTHFVHINKYFIFPPVGFSIPAGGFSSNGEITKTHTIMIPIEKQVITLEQAKTLKKLGVEQDSLFYWINCYMNSPIDKWKIVFKDEKEKYRGICESYSAFTIGELYLTDEMERLFTLWHNGWSKMNHYYNQSEKDGWYCEGGFGCGKECECSGLTLIEALYKHVVCYIENVSSEEEINQMIKG